MKMAVLLVLVGIFFTSLNAQEISESLQPIFPFQTLQGTFQKIFDRNGVADTVESQFYFQNTPFMFIETHSPFHQIMVIKNNETLIFYPRRQLAYQLSSERPPLLPAISYLVVYFNAEEGFANLGLNLTRQEFKGDTLITYWASPDPKKPIGLYRLAQYNERTIQVTYTSPDTSIINILSFKNFITLEGITLPQFIVSEKTSPKHYTVETVLLKKLKINLPIPAEYLNFTVPGGTKVVKKKW